MELSQRLQHLAGLVRPGVFLADIGTDHGNLPAALLESDRIRFAVATDIHAKPLAKAAALFEKYGFSDRSDCRLGSGLLPLRPGECETIVIAGMGGLMIRDMFDEAEETARQAQQLILQPMNNTMVLRQYLAEHHYRIIHESIVADRGYHYEVMIVQDGVMRPLSLAESAIGFASVRHEDDAFQAFVKEYFRKTKEIYDIVSLKNTENAQCRAAECRALMFALEKVISVF